MKVMYVTTAESLKSPNIARGSVAPFWAEALRASEHTTLIFTYEEMSLPKPLRKIARKIRNRHYRRSFSVLLDNRRLVAAARRFNPDIVLLHGGNDFIKPGVISYLRQSAGTRFGLLVEKAPVKYITRAEYATSPLYDCVFSSDAGHAADFGQLGARKSIVLPVAGIDPKIHRRRTPAEKDLGRYGCDVAYVGSPHRAIEKALIPLSKHGLAIWGDPKEWKAVPKLAAHFKGAVKRAETLTAIYNAAKLVVNIHPYSMQAGGNRATFEIAGCGGVQLIDRYDSKWFSKREVIPFRDSSDLSRLAGKFLSAPEKLEGFSIAAEAKAHKKHTYKTRLKKLLRELTGTTI